MPLNKNLAYYFTPEKCIFMFLGMVLLASIFWYQERMLFIDPAFILFEIINSKSFIISEHRYAAMTTQIVPLTGVWLGLSLNTLLLLYSMSFNLFYLIVAYWVIIKWKDLTMGILLVSFHMLHLSDGFFWPNNEVYQGVTWGILAIAYYRYIYKRQIPVHWYNIIFWTIMLFMATNAHLLSCLVITCIWFYYLLSDFRLSQIFKNRYTNTFSSILITGIIIRWLLSHNSWYDGEKLNQVKSIGWHSVADTFTNAHAKWMYGQLLGGYWTTLLFMVTGVLIIIKLRKNILAFYYAVAIVVYFVLVTLTFPDFVERHELFYMESQWAGWAAIIALPLAFHNHLLPFSKKWFAGLILIAFLWRGLEIYRASDYFTKRLEQLESLVISCNELSQGPVLLYTNDQQSHNLIMDWGLPVESLLHSNLNTHLTSTSCKIISDATNLQLDSVFHAPFKIMPLDTLNSNYFKFKEWGRYKLVEIEALHN